MPKIKFTFQKERPKAKKNVWKRKGTLMLKKVCLHAKKKVCYENKGATPRNPLHVPVGPITRARARAKRFKEALSGLI